MGLQAVIDELEKQGVEIAPTGGRDVNGKAMYAVAGKYTLKSTDLLALEREGKVNLAGLEELHKRMLRESEEDCE